MSSTVTASTVSTVTAAASFGDVGGYLLLIGALMLAVTAIAREVSSANRTARGVRFARGLDLALAPLLAVFGVTIYLS